MCLFPGNRLRIIQVQKWTIMNNSVNAPVLCVSAQAAAPTSAYVELIECKQGDRYQQWLGRYQSTKPAPAGCAALTVGDPNCGRPTTGWVAGCCTQRDYMSWSNLGYWFDNGRSQQICLTSSANAKPFSPVLETSFPFNYYVYMTECGMGAREMPPHGCRRPSNGICFLT